MPPCKHYQNQDQIMNDATKYLHSEDFKTHLSPRKLQGLRHALLDQGLSNQMLSTYNAEQPLMLKDSSVMQLNETNMNSTRNMRGSNMSSVKKMGHGRNGSLPGIG